jgi:hypothetical protein
MVFLVGLGVAGVFLAPSAGADCAEGGGGGVYAVAGVEDRAAGAPGEGKAGGGP